MTTETHAASASELKSRIETALPGSHAEVTGDGHHFDARVSGPMFNGLSRVAQHKLVYSVFGAELGDRIHALALKITATESQ